MASDRAADLGYRGRNDGRRRDRLAPGGSRLEVDGKVVVDAPSAEYPGVYARFDALLRAGQSEVDAAPLRLAADAFLLARRTAVEAFEP